MKRGIYSLLGVAGALALAVSCKEDPTSSLREGPSTLNLEFAYREVIIGDSVKVTATIRDGQNNPLEIPVTVSVPASCTAGIASVSPTSAAPLPVTAFYVKGLAYGQTCVVGTVQGLSDTMDVATFPYRIAIVAPDTMVSGVPQTFPYSYFDAVGNVITGPPTPPAPSWSSTSSTTASVDATGLVTPKDPGQVRVEVVGVGSPDAGVTFGRTFNVKAAAFTGTVVPSPAFPGQTVTITRGATAPVFDANSQVLFNGASQTLALSTADSVRVAIPDLASAGAIGMLLRRLGTVDLTQGDSFDVLLPNLEGGVTPASASPTDTLQAARGTGPLFDADTRAYVRGLRTFIIPNTADQVGVVVPGVGATGPVEVRFTRMDAANVARKDTVSSATASLSDHYDIIGNDGFPVAPTNPSITANGDYYLVESGTCSGGAPTDPGDDCDDFFQVPNPSGIDTLFASVQLDWFSGSDVDILWCKNTTCSGAGNVVTGGGATLNNPEISNVKIPPGATWYLWINYFEPIGVTKDVLRVRFSGLP